MYHGFGFRYCQISLIACNSFLPKKEIEYMPYSPKKQVINDKINQALLGITV